MAIASRLRQRGGTFLGLILGVVIGLGAALAVAVYVTKVPVPFLNKGQNRTVEQDAAEARKNRDWDPNGPLAGRNPARPGLSAPSPSSDPAPAPAASPPASAATGRAPAASSDPLGDLARSRSEGAPVTQAAVSPSAAGTDPFSYFVQAGAFRSVDEAEAQRAKLSLMGVEARVTEREQSGRTVYRVRSGPFDRKDDADRTKARLDGAGFDTALVRVQR